MKRRSKVSYSNWNLWHTWEHYGNRRMSISRRTASPSTRRAIPLAVVSLLSALSGCDALTGLTSGDCTTMAVPAISVTVVDSVTGASLSQGTTVRVRDGLFSDSVTVAGSPGDTERIAIGLAYERAGTYQVTVSHPGFVDWAVDNVRVTTVPVT
jgi:hypothetical protein